MIQIKLAGINGAGRFALVSPEDASLVSRYSWYYRDGYAIAMVNNREVRMHRMIMNETNPDVIIDHQDRNRLNNCRNNLRRFNFLQNANNREDNYRLTCFGEEKTIAEWSRDERCLVSYEVLRGRLRNGYEAWASILAPDKSFLDRCFDGEIAPVLE